MALLSGGLIYPLKFAVDRHNRFILAFTFLFDSIVFLNLILIGKPDIFLIAIPIGIDIYEINLFAATQINSFTVPIFNKVLQADCLRNTPQTYSSSECSAFYNSDRTAGMRLAWEYYFTNKADKTKNQVLAQLQGSGNQI